MKNKFTESSINDSVEFFFIAMSMLEKSGRTNIIPELLQILTPHQIIMMSHVLGNRTVKFPSAKDLSIALKAALHVYETRFLGLPASESKKSLDVSDAEYDMVLENISKWASAVKSEMGGGLYTLMIRGRE